MMSHFLLIVASSTMFAIQPATMHHCSTCNFSDKKVFAVDNMVLSLLTMTLLYICFAPYMFCIADIELLIAEKTEE